MADLSKTRTLMERTEEWPPTFVPETDPGAVVRVTTLIVDRADWEDMGRPDVISVTVEPGDTLNPASTPADAEHTTVEDPPAEVPSGEALPPETAVESGTVEPTPEAQP